MTTWSMSGIHRRRAVLASLLSGMLIASLAVGLSPAQAASLGDVSVSYNPFPLMTYDVTPSTLNGAAVNDTFTLKNTLTSGDDDPAYYVSLVNDTGSVSMVGMGVTPCTSSGSCPVLDLFNGLASGDFVVDGLGTVKVIRVYSGNATGDEIGTLTFTAGGGGAANPEPVTTATLDPNGGSCSAPKTVDSVNFAVTPFTLPTCSRTSYDFLGWARDKDATAANWPGGALLSVSSDSFTLYAVYRPQGVEVTYDANVGMDVKCLAEGANRDTRDGRRVTRVVGASSSGEAVSWDGSAARWASSSPAPVCTPTGFNFLGWSTSPSGKPLDGVSAGAVVPATGRLLTLYAVWAPVQTVTARSITITGERTTVSGKPGISVEGRTTGFAAGDVVVPYVKFPGQTSYTQGSARPTVDANGSFGWERKTGKKTYVYFTNSDGSVKSNVVIIPAQ